MESAVEVVACVSEKKIRLLTNREKDENKIPQYFIFVLGTIYIIWIEKIG